MRNTIQVSGETAIFEKLQKSPSNLELDPPTLIYETQTSFSF